MLQVDEGLIHAWLDGQLPPDEAARVERLVATDAAWSAAAADARGLVAGASRILGALDDEPSVRNAGAIGGVTRGKRSVWREPWLRAAAAVLLLVGVGSLTVRQWPGDQTVAVTKEAPAIGSAVRESPSAEQNKTLPSAAPGEGRAGAVDARDKSTPLVASGERAREEIAAKKTVSGLDGARGGALGAVSGTVVVPPAGAGAGGGVAAANAVAAAGAANTGATASTTKQTAVVDSLKIVALAPQKPGVAPLADAGRAAVTVGGAGGRGGRSGAVSPNRQAMDLAAGVREQGAKALESVIIDPRVSGCWLATDSAPGSAYLLKFIDPIATDLQRAAAAAPAARFAGPAPVSRALQVPPKDARVQNTTPRSFNADSLFTAEWVSGDTRMNLTFTVRGDTLTGATHLAAGDVRYAGVPFRAVRVQCPQ